MSAKKISVIIPAFNCEKTIGRVLQAALTAVSEYRNSLSPEDASYCGEIIVVDDGSTDQTKVEILKYPTVKYLFQQNQGPAAARNHGAQESRGEILFFTDSDCIPHGDWVELMLSYFKKPDISVVAGSYGIANSEKRLSRCVHREIIYRHMNLMPENPQCFGSFNFAIKREVFQAVGGFDTRYLQASGEDNDLSYKITSGGYKILFAKDVLVDHFHPENVGKYLSEQYRHGFWRVRMYLDHPKMTKGDGYTFWKDIVEVGLVLAVYLGLILILISFFAVGASLFAGALIFLVGINAFFGIKMIGDWKDGFYFGDIMNLRAFARTNGFISGAMHFLLRQELLKSKKE